MKRRPILLLLLLVSVGLRTVFGAPCCIEPAVAADQVQFDHSDMAHGAHSNELHDAGVEGDTTANPCCSACGPTLAPEPALMTGQPAPLSLAQPTPIRALATRPPFPAYDATGPPELI